MRCDLIISVHTTACAHYYQLAQSTLSAPCPAAQVGCNVEVCPVIFTLTWMHSKLSFPRGTDLPGVCWPGCVGIAALTHLPVLAV